MNVRNPIATFCRNHPNRETASRCMGCSMAFCRECVTLVERRMFCASCYKTRTGVQTTKNRDWFVFSVAAQLVVGLGGLWLSAYVAGKLLAKLPASFHEGTIWKRLSDEFRKEAP